MPSSKFNQTPTPVRRPAICHPPIFPPLPPVPFNRPRDLQAYVDWWDLDPLDPIGAGGFARLQQIDDKPTYYGRSHPEHPAIGAKVYPAATTDHYDVDAILYVNPQRTETWTFHDVYVDPEKPFDTGWLKDINLPGQDYRFAHILD